MTKQRWTLEVLRSGQPRAYADSETVARVTFEYTPWNSETGEFEPWPISEKSAREQLSGMRCGFVATPKSEAGFLGTYLDYLRPVDDRPEDPSGKASVWEFRTVHPYTD